MTRPALLRVSIALWAAACSFDVPEEGTGAAECSDGIDNDANGAVDCEDDGCAAECGADSDADSDSDTGTGSEVCDPACGENEVCADGVCRCAPGLIDCGSVCADASSDESNCGGCDETCNGGETCVSGQCR